ncbi:hypothetical protein J6590_013263 [Homalodisca vitripennis]|nr:hypothetical protein J6590_013263 [Homalodisca vitripennis]
MRSSPQPRLTWGPTHSLARVRMSRAPLYRSQAVRSSPQPRLTWGPTHSLAQPRMSRAPLYRSQAVRSSPQPRLTWGPTHSLAQPRMSRASLYRSQAVRSNPQPRLTWGPTHILARARMSRAPLYRSQAVRSSPEPRMTWGPTHSLARARMSRAPHYRSYAAELFPFPHSRRLILIIELDQPLDRPVISFIFSDDRCATPSRSVIYCGSLQAGIQSHFVHQWDTIVSGRQSPGLAHRTQFARSLTQSVFPTVQVSRIVPVSDSPGGRPTTFTWPTPSILFRDKVSVRTESPGTGTLE